VYLWQPQKVGRYMVVVRQFTLRPGDYRFEAKVRIRGSVETHLRCGGIHNNHIIANCPQHVPVKDFLKIGQ